MGSSATCRPFFDAVPLLKRDLQGTCDGLKVDSSGNVLRPRPVGSRCFHPMANFWGPFFSALPPIALGVTTAAPCISRRMTWFAESRPPRMEHLSAFPELFSRSLIQTADSTMQVRQRPRYHNFLEGAMELGEWLAGFSTGLNVHRLTQIPADGLLAAKICAICG